MSRSGRSLRPAGDRVAWTHENEELGMKFLLIMNVDPAVLDALTQHERNAIGTGHGAGGSSWYPRSDSNRH